MPHHTKKSETGGTDLMATLNWDVAFAEASRLIFLAPFWWYMPVDTTAALESSLPITTTYVHACKLCSKADQVVTEREVSQS